MVGVGLHAEFVCQVNKAAAPERRVEKAGDLCGIDGGAGEVDASAAQVAKVEPNVVPDDRVAPGELTEPGGELFQRWRSGYVAGRDARHVLNEQGNFAARVHEGLKGLEFGAAFIEANEADLRDVILFGIEPGGLDIDGDESRWRQGRTSVRFRKPECTGQTPTGHARFARSTTAAVAIAGGCDTESLGKALGALRAAY